MDQVGTLIDMLGGIEVAVPVGFTDKEFPRPDVDVTVERDPAVLYQTVTFEQGEQTLSGERALQYIRSRKSGDEQGDDTARSERQQQVITALSSKIMSRELLTNPEILGKLTRYYQETFEQYLPLTQAAAVVRQLVPQRQNISITSHSLPISPTDPEGVISNPPLRKYSLWVYEVVSPQVFSDYVQKKLLH